MATPTLRPFRDYDEKDVLNLYAATGYTAPVNKGTLFKISGPGVQADGEAIEMLGPMGDFQPSNVVAQRYGVLPKITPITSAADNVIGMSLFDIKEVDENGFPLKYYPRKAAEMEAVISGQALPLVYRGLFAYSGVETGNSLTGVITAGTPLFPSANAVLTNVPYLVTGGLGVQTSGRPIATALGTTTADGTTMILLHIK